MNKIKDKIFADLQMFSHDQKIINFADLQEAEKILESFPASNEDEDENELEELLDDLDPAFLMYFQVVEFIMMISALISTHPSLKKNKALLMRLENKYMQDEIFSPVTDSYFNFWRLFDLQIDESGETMSSLCLSIAEHLGNYSEELQYLADKACSTRMGLYVQEDFKDGTILLREIISNQKIEVISPSLYEGAEGEIWFVRIFPPIAEGQPSLIMTTPYIIKGCTEQDWVTFFKKQGIIKDDNVDEDAFTHFMKYGPKPDYWMKYISKNVRERDDEDCIFLLGLPNIVKKKVKSAVNTDSCS